MSNVDRLVAGFFYGFGFAAGFLTVSLFTVVVAAAATMT